MKRYDRAYFDKWYRSPGHRIGSDAALRRKVGMVVGMTEFLLQRAIRSVLDVGCGEGRWHAPLRRLRPRVRYLGVEPSEYAVGRFGRRRNLIRGSFEALDRLDLAPAYDLIVCSDVLHYVPDRHLAQGLAAIRAHLGGVAFLETYTKGDDIGGDLAGFHRRPASRYRRLFASAGLVPCGMQCYLPDDLAEGLTALERPGG